MIRKQSGAVEACWAHNPEVRRSKLRSAITFLFDTTTINQVKEYIERRLVKFVKFLFLPKMGLLINTNRIK